MQSETLSIFDVTISYFYILISKDLNTTIVSTCTFLSLKHRRNNLTHVSLNFCDKLLEKRKNPFMKPLRLSEELAAFVGQSEMPRPQVLFTG